ncbi:MAG: glycoside hydrolase family 2 [Ruminococcaceae bacterium]|nr:glycoside hydrolase family 2 [Oscillospiraceae bacterium]
MSGKNELKTLYTDLAKEVGDVPHNEYPRPLMERDSFLCLNGKWDFCVTKSGETPEYGEKILVPFPPESALSEIGKVFEDGSYYNYRRSFSLPEGFNRGKVLLNFGAVDRECEVYVNGTLAGVHRGGYFPFSFDITALLRDENLLCVRAFDKLGDYMMPYGKQKLKRGGMWYTPVSGIWQTVWLESVPEEHIVSLEHTVDLTGADITVNACGTGAIVTVHTESGDITKETDADGRVRFDIPSPRLWSPEDPYLYGYTVKCGEDTVKSYFGLRTVEIGEVNGKKRMLLNGKPYFYNGLLDQGYWSDGLFLPATEQGYANDVNCAKSLGFNMLRKHIKIEPQRFYYECDRSGIAVFQDMINNGKYSFFFDTALPTVLTKHRLNPFAHRDEEQRAEFVSAMEQTVSLLKNHPSIVLWTVFNEGWGQFDTDNVAKKLKALDPSRHIDSASGWYICKNNEFDSRHVYFKKFKVGKVDKPLYLSEFGGYSYKPEGHVFNTEETYGYRMFESGEKYADAVEELFEREVIPAVKEGLCATVYTQLSDVEDETNGVITYDRKVVKLRPERMRQIAEKIKKEL